MTEPTNDVLKEAKEYYEGFPEAPYSDSFKWIDSNGFEHLSTVRAWTGGTLLTGIDKATSAIVSKGGKPAGGKPAPAQMPAPQAEETKIQLKTEDGLPVVDVNQQPVMVQLPEGVHLFQVAGLFHGKTQAGKDYLGVKTVEQPYSKKWGVKCFHPTGINGWKAWQIGENEPLVYAPPDNAKHVLIRDPKEQGGFADVLEFRA